MRGVALLDATCSPFRTIILCISSTFGMRLVLSEYKKQVVFYHKKHVFYYKKQKNKK